MGSVDSSVFGTRQVILSGVERGRDWSENEYRGGTERIDAIEEAAMWECKPRSGQHIQQKITQECVWIPVHFPLTHYC